ncbi:DUF4150 domain-containing protein [Phytopseudomonas punonensis]|uniref:Uncharacterized protein n=1 Tax=Phytopseudomonas punonensis TaxID=1220495 RepID=A0A1M6ZWD4_9GAMM|nr:DUF4150 domain-containing protein [Pseudomonas punonensis]SHL34689.1 protein of unknown function [Pseudomonas punonensis]
MALDVDIGAGRYHNADLFRKNFGIDSAEQAAGALNNLDSLYARGGHPWEAFTANGEYFPGQRESFDKTARQVKDLYDKGVYKDGELAESKPTEDGKDLVGNARHAANDSHEWKAVCSVPDFCKVGNAVVPFDSFATIGNQTQSSPDVKAQGVPVYRVGDLHKGVQGDAGSHVVAGTSLGGGHVKFLSGQNDVKVNGIPLVRQDSTCLVNCNGAGIGGALGKVVTTQRGADTQAEKTAEETNPELQALLDAEADERSLWEKTKDFGSGAWSSTKRIAEASVDDPLDTGVGVLKGIGNLPTDLWNLGVMASKYSTAAGIPPIALRAQVMEKAALAAHQAGDLTKANELASQASKMMNAGYAGDLFELTSDAQTGGSVLSMFIPGSVVVKGASRAGKAARGVRVLDEAADAEKAVDVGKSSGPGVHVKAATGEKAAHEAMVGKGYEPLGKTDGNYKPGQNGIDGVYKNSNPPPEYIITEAKYGSSQLNKRLADGANQMDDAWVMKRLDSTVGREQADLIRDAMDAGTVQKILLRVDEGGNVTPRLIDSSGNVVRGNAGKVPGF